MITSVVAAGNFEWFPPRALLGFPLGTVAWKVRPPWVSCNVSRGLSSLVFKGSRISADLETVQRRAAPRRPPLKRPRYVKGGGYTSLWLLKTHENQQRNFQSFICGLVLLIG